jgi:hypothetical protein
MKALRTGIAILVVAAVALSIGVGVMAANGGDSRNETFAQRFDRSAVTGVPRVDPERRAELIRSRALNRRYGLGEFAPWPLNIKDPELRALMIRSDALNRKYKLGKYAPGS